MKLVIVESPTKAKTISRFLGKDFIIKASFGHVMDLPKSKLGVDIDNKFAPQYEISPDKKQTITELKKLAKDAEQVILATDPDREGEAISSHIQDVLSDGKGKHKHFARIVFHEITKSAIEDALQHPGTVNTHLVDAQTARRVLDRLVGYKISPVLWQKVRRGLSAGRVQSVALRLIVEREREIEKFQKEPYWTIKVQLNRQNAKIKSENVVASDQGERGDLNEVVSSQVFRNDVDKPTEFELTEINGEKIETSQKFKLYDGEYTVGKTTILSQDQADTIVKELKTQRFIVADVLQKASKRSPQPPFTTSTLQQEAARRFGYSGKRTMALAQKLYEEGFISYHRTDSVNLAAQAVTAMREYVTKNFGENYLPESPRVYANKQKLAQEAHEAIRPTKPTTAPGVVSQELGGAYGKLYELIWRRAIASQMADAQIESTTVLVDANSEGSKVYRFKANGSVLVFEGFLKMNPFGLQDRKLPVFAVAEALHLDSILPETHETSAPPRYNDASLIGALEEEGIGRPSTYASIISTIETRNYIERDAGRFIPTPVGIAVNDFLVKNFSDIDDIPFTARMEDELDAIANDGKDWVPMMQEFYEPFEKKLKSVSKADRIQIETEQTGEMCPKDGAPLVVRVGKFGKFISCSNFPACDFKKPYVLETPYTCPKDGGKIIAKKTKKGKTFYGCSNYPACTYASWKLEDIRKDLSTGKVQGK
jgi:DNA topoisomerase-1